MKIELRNVRHAAFASEETNCFKATVYLDGVPSGEASNDGRGGCNNYYPYELKQKLDAYGKTLPVKVTTYKNPASASGFWELQYDADLLIGDALEQFLMTKDLRRALAKKVLFVESGKLWEIKSGPSHGDTITRVEAKYPAAQILNTMDFADALKLYMERR